MARRASTAPAPEAAKPAAQRNTQTPGQRTRVSERKEKMTDVCPSPSPAGAAIEATAASAASPQRGILYMC